MVTLDKKTNNKQAVDLVKSHLLDAVREEVEVLKEKIKEPPPQNFQLKQKNNLLYKHGQFQAAYSFRPIYKMTL